MLSVGAAARRVRAFGGQFLLLAVLTMTATLLVSGVPRLVNWYAGQGLHQFLADRPAQERDLTYSAAPLTATANGTSLMEAYRSDLETIRAGMPPRVRELVAQRWFSAQTEPSRVVGRDLAARNLTVDLGLRVVPDIREAATLVEGRWPDRGPVPSGQPVQVALAAQVAGQFNLRVGSRLTLRGPDTPGVSLPPTPIAVVGLFAPRDGGDGIWDALPPLLRVVEPLGDGQPFIGFAVVDEAALDRQAAIGWSLRLSWRYRLSADMDVRALDQILAGLQEMSRRSAGRTFVQGLDVPLRQFIAGMDAARTVLAVIAAGTLATLGGLVLLATGSAVRRRRGEFALLRARGGGPAAGAGRSLAESLLVVPPAAVLGWLAGTLAPGGAGDTLGLAVALTVLVTLALPVATLTARAEATGRREGLRLRPSTRRLGVEGGLLLLAALAVVLLRRRGLESGAVDPLLVSVPVLLAVAAALVAIRLYPLPLRLLSRLAARARGSVAFLGTARAGRAQATAPLVVVVLAIATAAFSAVVAAGVEASRDRAATAMVPGDALLRGERFAPDTRAELERVPGVRVAAPLAEEPAQRLAKDAVGTDARIGDATVLLVDAAALDRVAATAGRGPGLPRTLVTAGPGGSAPAVVSPAVAADLARAGLTGSAFITVQGQRYEFRVAGQAETFPLLTGGGDRFVVLPWQALPTREYAVVPTGFVLAGENFDAARLRAVGTEGQSRFQRGSAVNARERNLPVEVSTWTTVRRELGEGGPNGVLVFGFVAGAAGGTVLGLLAIAFTVLAGARARGQVLSRLRTLGLSRGQGRGLLLIELSPLVGAAVLTGALVGALLPVLLNPVLGLATFTRGTPVRVAFEPALVAGVVALGAVALGFAVAVEALNNRRLRLGEALRLGEES